MDNESKMSHNPYFNRWFSAIISKMKVTLLQQGHNPYFNRWFSAINISFQIEYKNGKVTILILIDGFLQ